MATGAAAMARVIAWLRTRSRQRVAASVQRWSSAWGETATPSVAAVWASSSRAACGLARKPKTNVWVKVAPPSGEVRWTNLVARRFVRGGRQKLLHGGRDVCYSRHREAPAEYHGVRQQHDATVASFRYAFG